MPVESLRLWTRRATSGPQFLQTWLEVHKALRRRGVAYDVAQAMTFEKHEELINIFSMRCNVSHWRAFRRSLLSRWLQQTVKYTSG